MGTDDREWLRHDRRRWSYRLRADLPYWVREWIRAGLFSGALGLLYLAWPLIRG